MAEESGEIFVKLSADIAALKSGVDAALSELGKFAKKAEDLSERSSGAWGSFISDVDKSKAVFAGIGAAVGVAAVSILHSFADAQTAVFGLTGALANQGITSRATVADLEEYASALQAQSTFSDDAILSAQALLVNYGLTGEQLKKVTKETLDFAAATGKDLAEATAAVGAALAGRGRELVRYGITVTETMTKEERLTAIMDGFTKFAGRASLATETLEGSVKQLFNNFSDLQENLGALIAGDGKSLVDLLNEWVVGINKFIQTHPGFTKLMLIIGGLIGAFASLLAGVGVFVAYVQGPLMAVFGVIFSSIGGIVAAIAAVGAVIVALVTDFLGIRTVIQNVLAEIFGNLGTLMSAIQAMLSGNFAMAKALVSNAANAVWEEMKIGFTDVSAAAKAKFNEVKINFGMNADAIAQKSKEANEDIMGHADTTRQSVITNQMMMAEGDKARTRAAIKDNQNLYDVLGIQQENWVTNAKALSNSFFNQFGNGVADMIQKGRSFSDVMKSIWQDMTRQIISMIAQMIAKWLIFQAMTGGAGGSFGSFFGGGGGGGGGFFAEGGVIGEPSIITGLKSGKQVVAGKSGPEAVVPMDQMAALNNAAQGGGGGGGGNMTVNVSINGQFLEGDESKWQLLIRDRIVPEIERFAMTRPVGPFTRRRGATA